MQLNLWWFYICNCLLVLVSKSHDEEPASKRLKKSNHADKHSFTLKHGSLLVMRGNTQRDWIHSVPKRTKVEANRINLTFRHVLWWVQLKENFLSLGFSLLTRSWRSSRNKVPCILLGDRMYCFLDNLIWMLKRFRIYESFWNMQLAFV